MSEGTNTDHCPEAHKSFRFLVKKDKAKKKKLNFLLSNVVKELGPGNKNWFENATAKKIQQKKQKLEHVDSSLCTPKDKIHSNEQSDSCSTSSDNKFYSKIQRLLTSQTSTPTELWQVPVLGASPDVVSGAAPQCKQMDIRKSLGIDLNDSLLSWTSSMATPTLMDSTYKGSPSPVVKPQKGLPRVLFSPGPSQTDEDLHALENTSEDNTDDDEEPHSILSARRKSKTPGILINPDVAVFQNINQQELFNTDSENLTETDSEEKFNSKSRVSSKNCKKSSTGYDNVASSVIEEESMPLFSQDLYMEDEIEESKNQDVMRVSLSIKQENLSKTTADDSGVSEVLSDFFDPPSSAVGRRRCAPRKGKKRKLLADSLNFGGCDEIMVSYSTPKSKKKKTAWLSIEDKDDQNKNHLQKEGGEIKQEFQMTVKSEKVEDQHQTYWQKEENERIEELKITVKSEQIEGELPSTSPKISFRNRSLSLSQEEVSHENCSTPNNANKTLKSILSSKKDDGSAVKSNKKVRFSVEEKSSLKRNLTQLEDEECVSPDVFVENFMTDDVNTSEKTEDDCRKIPPTISEGDSAQNNLMSGNIRSDKLPKTDSDVEICDELFSQVSPTALNEMCSVVTMVDTDNVTQKSKNNKTNIKLAADDNPVSVKVENKDTTLPEMKTEIVDKVSSHPIKTEGTLPVHETSNPKPNSLRSSFGFKSKPRKFLYPSSNQINKLCPKTVYGFAEQKNMSLTMDTHNSASTVTPQDTELVHDQDQQSVINSGTGEKGGNKSWQDRPTLNTGIRRSIGFESFSSMAKSGKLDAETDKPEVKRDGIKSPLHGDARKLIATETMVKCSKGEQNEKDYHGFSNNVQSPTRFETSSVNGQLSKGYANQFSLKTEPWDPDFNRLRRFSGSSESGKITGRTVMPKSEKPSSCKRTDREILQKPILSNQLISGETGKHKVNCMESKSKSTRKVNYMESENTSTNMNIVSGDVNTMESGMVQVAGKTTTIPNIDSSEPIRGDHLKHLPSSTGFTGFSSASGKSMNFSEEKLHKAKQLFVSIDCDTGITDDSSLQLTDVNSFFKDINMAEIKEAESNHEMKLPRQTCTNSHAVLSNWKKTTSTASTTKSDIIHSHFKTAPAFAKDNEAKIEDMLEKVLEARNSSGPAVFENAHGRTWGFQTVRNERVGSKHTSFEKAMSVIEDSTVVSNLDVISMSTDPVNSKTGDNSRKHGNREGSVDATETNADFKGFATASGKCLKLSDTSLKKASALLDDVNTNFTLTGSPLQASVEEDIESIKGGYEKARNSTVVKDNANVSSRQQIPVEISTQQIGDRGKVLLPTEKASIDKSCSVDGSVLETVLPTENVLDELTMNVPRKTSRLSTAGRKSLQMRSSCLGNSTKSLDTKITCEQNNNNDVASLEKQLGNHSNVEKMTFSEKDKQMDVEITDDTASGTKRKLGSLALMELMPHVGDFGKDEQSKTSQTQDGNSNDTSKSADIGSTGEFGGFSTAGGKKLKVSDSSLKKALSLVSDVDAGDLSTVSGPRNSITETSVENKSAVCSIAAELGGFSTAAGNKLKVSDKSMKTAMSLIADVDSAPDATDVPNKGGPSEYNTRSSGKNSTESNMDDFCTASGLGGFSTAGGKKLKLSENSMRKAMSVISEVADTDDIAMHDGFKKSSSLATGEFQTATGRHLQISDASLGTGMSVLRDVDAEVMKEPVLFHKNTECKDITDVLNLPRKSESTASKEKGFQTNTGRRTSSRFPPGAVVPKGFRPFKPPKITKKPDVEKTTEKPCVNMKDKLPDGEQGVKDKSMQSALETGKDIPAVSESNNNEPSKTFSYTFDRTIKDVREISKGENFVTDEENHKDKMSNLKEEKVDQDIEPSVMDELFSEEFESSQRFSPGSGKVLWSRKGSTTPGKPVREADVLPSEEYEEFLDMVLCEATEIKCEPPSQNETSDNKMSKAVGEINKVETFLKEVPLLSDQYDTHLVSKTLTPGQASGFSGFQCASGKNIRISEDAVRKAKQNFEDLSSELEQDSEKMDELIKQEIKEYSELKVEECSEQQAGYSGLQSDSGMNDFSSNSVLSKDKQSDLLGNKTVMEADMGKVVDSNNVTEDEIEMPAESLNMKPCHNSTNHLGLEFGGFTSASGKKVKVSEEAMTKARQSISDWCSETTDDKNTTAKDRPDQEMVPEFGRFQSASGKKVRVSDEALAKARQNVSDWSCEVTENKTENIIKDSFHKENVSEFAGFQSASGKKVSVSNQALAKARQNINNWSSDLPVVIEPLQEKTEHLERLCPDKESFPRFAGFQSASGKKVSVSNTALAKARQNLSDWSSELNLVQSDLPESSSFGDDGIDSNGDKSCIHPNNRDLCEGINFSGDNKEVKEEDWIFPKCKHDGTSEKIWKSESVKIAKDEMEQESTGLCLQNDHYSLQEVMNSQYEFSQDESDMDVEQTVIQCTSDFPNAANASRKKVHASENSTEQAGKILDDVGNSPFQSASGKKVTISENAIEQTRKVFDDVGNSPFQSASGQKVSISENALEKARKELDDVGNSPFQSASGQKVNISENALEHVKQTMAMAEVSGSPFHSASGKKVDITESALQHARKSMENTDSSFKNVSRTVTGHTPSGMNRGSETNVKGNSLSFNSPFQTATGNEIHISESSLQHVRKVTASLESSTQLDNQKSSSSGPEHVKQDKGPRLTYHIRKEVSTVQDNQSCHPVEENFVTPSKHRGGPTTPRTCQQSTMFSPCGLSDTDRPVFIEGINHSLDEFCQPDDFLEEMEVTPKRRKVKEEAVIKRSGMVKPMKCVPEAFTRDRQDRSCSLRARVSFSTPTQASRSSIPTQSSITNSQTPAKSSFLTPYKKPDASKSDSHTTPQTCAADQAAKKPTPKFIPKCLSAPQSDVVKSKTPTSTSLIQKDKNQSENRQETKKEDDKLVKLDVVELLKEARKHQDELLKVKEKSKVSPDPGRLYTTKKGSIRQRMRDVIKLQTRYVGRSQYQHSQLQVGSVRAATAVHHKFYLPDFYTNFQGHVYVGDGAYLVPDDKLYAGKEELFRAFSTLAGVDCRLISDAWFYNHYKWLVWKLAAYEVTSPHNFAGRALTPEVVMLQMKYRYDREIDNCQRSALKKIMERDDTASKRMVLCVCGIHQQSQPDQSDVASKSTNKGDKQTDRNEKPTSATSKQTSSTDKLDSQVCVELTDGWYSIAARLDVPLSDHVIKHRIRVGDKLCVSGAELQGPQDACTPLEAPPSLMLKLCANSTRPAPWDAKLGYQSDPRPLCIPLSGLYGEGGNVGCIDVVLARKYPQMYMEKLGEGGSVFRTSLAENKYQHQYQRHRQDEMEKLYAKLQSEFEREDTEEKCISKKKWTKREVELLQTGHEIYEAYSTSRQPDMIEEYLSDRQRELLMERRRQVQDEKRQKLHEEFQKTWQTTSERTVIPLVKMRFVGCSRKDMDSKASTTVTVWRPTQDVMELKEGTRYKIFGLNASSSRSKYKECDVQLTATRQTRFMTVSIDENLLDMIYEPREVLSVRDIKCRQPMYGEADFVGMVVSVSTMDFAESGRHQDVVYAADVHGSILGIKFWGGLKSFSLEDVLCEGRMFCASNLMDKSLYRSSSLPLLEASLECVTISQTSQYPAQRRALDRLKSVATDTHGFLERAKEALLVLQRQKKENTRKFTPEKNLKQDTEPLDSVLNTPVERKLSTSTSTPTVGEESMASRTSKQGQAAYQARMARLLNFGSPAPLSPLATNISRTVKKEFKPPSLRRKSLGPNH